MFIIKFKSKSFWHQLIISGLFVFEEKGLEFHFKLIMWSFFSCWNWNLTKRKSTCRSIGIFTDGVCIQLWKHHMQYVLWKLKGFLTVILITYSELTGQHIFFFGLYVLYTHIDMERWIMEISPYLHQHELSREN